MKRKKSYLSVTQSDFDFSQTARRISVLMNLHYPQDVREHCLHQIPRRSLRSSKFLNPKRTTWTSNTFFSIIKGEGLIPETPKVHLCQPWRHRWCSKVMMNLIWMMKRKTWRKNRLLFRFVMDFILLWAQVVERFLHFFTFPSTFKFDSLIWILIFTSFGLKLRICFVYKQCAVLPLEFD